MRLHWPPQFCTSGSPVDLCSHHRRKPLRQAAAEAYDVTLSNMHSYMVRMAIKTSMYMLPNRDQFLASINETGASFVYCQPLVIMGYPLVTGSFWPNEVWFRARCRGSDEIP